MHGAPGGEILGQHRPLAAGFEQVTNRVETGTRGIGIALSPPPAFRIRRVDQGFDQLPLCITKVGVVACWPVGLRLHLLSCASNFSLATFFCRIGSYITRHDSATSFFCPTQPPSVCSECVSVVVGSCADAPRWALPLSSGRSCCMRSVPAVRWAIMCEP